MKKLKLSTGQYAIVDDEDYEKLSISFWCLSSGGYARRGTKTKGKTTTHYMHRELLGYPKGCVDHINGNKLDNRKSNLRAVNQSINQHNRHVINCNNTSGYAGITIDKNRNKFVAEIWINYKKKTKRFESLKDAIRQRQQWEQELC